MRRTSWLNGVVLLLAIACSSALTWVFAVRVPDARRDVDSTLRASVQDADGVDVEVRPYERIVSGSTIADQVLVRIIEPSRLLAVSNHSLQADEAWRYEDKIGIGQARDIETIVKLRPDIVFINGFVDVRHVERMKEAGLTVFNLGEMRGVETLLPNIRQLASVLGVPERGEALANRFERRLQAVAADVPQYARRRAAYVGLHGNRLYGGTQGTSFHDALTAAGLIDVAAEAGYEGWPAYTSEQILSLDPPWIITNDRSVSTFCTRPGFDALAACQHDQVRGVDTDMLSDPGLSILRAAESVRDAVYSTPGGAAEATTGP